jgi:hypothetical protein
MCIIFEDDNSYDNTCFENSKNIHSDKYCNIDKIKKKHKNKIFKKKNTTKKKPIKNDGFLINFSD